MSPWNASFLFEIRPLLRAFSFGVSLLAAEKLIRETCQAQDCALVLITHNISQARRIADRVIALHQGRLPEQGDSAHILREPQQEQTKRFLDFYGT